MRPTILPVILERAKTAILDAQRATSGSGFDQLGPISLLAMLSSWLTASEGVREEDGLAVI
ncbi:hypothetical protein B0B36_18375 [Pseudomonas syringae pv. actinidifoliorum]|uniref:Uncharacterized protein n=1 Tax=Pseudomonas syringae pv. actinidiae TaxID=103796 RepID=M1J9H4_PSESF|nr:hypothetical protein [Pseudomonas syringae pv. actinidiae]AYL80109.1 hypothetical protein CN228_09145 [Pseudomonas syringae pv. actinidiae str. Shaanxi_M228]KTC11628.1 hypothetical protein AO390_09620 [Pseudomonas marginalis ICMP 11289]OOK95328.1 hypothetical protein B0B36_18375 [Pseudomonas syringae pv. actinidifoliorum]PYD04408.1 hypothetical protein DND90_09085 [Pseudomonas syringae pv. maculicola]